MSDFDNYKEHELTRPRDKAWSNFFKFENVGDKVQGYIRDVFYRPEEGVYKESRGITLEQEDGTLVNFTTKTLPFILAKTDGLRLGDPLTAEFEREEENTGKYATKIIEYYGQNLPENEGNVTVKELYEKDKNDGGTIPEEVTEGTEQKEEEPF